MAAVTAMGSPVRRSGARLLALAGGVAMAAARRLADGARRCRATGPWSGRSASARLVAGPGTTLDFGADIGLLSIAAALRGHDVIALDRLPPALQFEHERVTAVQADILDRPLADRRFDQIINCSSVEHVGLAGRYGSGERPDGDLEAMEILRGLLAPEAGWS